MSFFLNCPNCGPRDVTEFRYGGQLISQPSSPALPSEAEAKIAVAGSNLPGPQHERWYHRFGCRRWFMAERDVRKNEILHTGWLDENAS